jgi:hypothetical protein
VAAIFLRILTSIGVKVSSHLLGYNKGDPSLQTLLSTTSVILIRLTMTLVALAGRLMLLRRFLICQALTQSELLF